MSDKTTEQEQEQYEKIIKRVQKAEENQQKWSSYFDDLYQYFLPERDLSNTDQEKTKVFDSTANDSLSDYASRMESDLVPAGREWMKLEAGSEIPKEQETEVNQSLQKMTQILFQNINSSNFQSQINECFLDLGISTGAVIVEAGDGIQSSLRYRAVPLQKLMLERSEQGIVETVYSRSTLPYTDLQDLYPDVIDNLTTEQKRNLDDPTKEITIIEGVEKVQDLAYPYRGIVLCEDTKSVLRNQKLVSSPWVVFREQTTAGETYGRGRAMRCLQDVKTLNKVMEYYIDSCELLGNPIYTAVDDGIINPATIVVRPKTIIPVSHADSIRPLPQSGSPELNIDLMNRLQDSIRRTMFSKPFGKIDETPVRTATEMSIRNADLAKTSSSASGRIQSELLERLIERSVFVLKQAGKLPDFKVNGKEVKIKFTSPSAKQQNEIDLATTLRYIEMLQALPPEEVQTTVKIESFPKYIADIVGLDPNLLRTDGEKQAKIQEQQQIQQQTYQQELALRGQGGQNV